MVSSPAESSQYQHGNSPDNGERDSLVVPCASVQPLALLRVKVVGEDHAPLGLIAVEIVSAENRHLRSLTSRDGVCEFRGIPPGTYRLSLFELDKEAWEHIGTGQITEAPAGLVAADGWDVWSPPVVEQGMSYRIKQSECVAKIAFRHGFFPQTIWEDPKNTQLRRIRADLHIVAADDDVYIPPRRRGELAVQAGQSVSLLRKGVPERLRVRFLDVEHRPRVGVPFVLFVTLANGEECPEQEGYTDEAGFIDLPVSPDAAIANLFLDPAGSQEEIQLDLGFLDPAESNAGLQQRLNNLGYACGDEDGVAGELTRQAVAQLQADAGLSATGEMDSITRQKIISLTLS